jgi:3'-phosphoadenosine 5'-phosphosulfate sulfotransferase (PAPS reductase)/FAD synthetase
MIGSEISNQVILVETRVLTILTDLPPSLARISNSRPRINMSSYQLTHLKQLEAESIHIIREVAAEFDNPVMLYSIGKDSSVMVHLAMKAFYPAKPPFPLMHVNTTWKFQDMYKFRDEYTKKQLGLDIITYVNEEGLKLGVDPLRAQCQTYDHHENRCAQASIGQIQI